MGGQSDSMTRGSKQHTLGNSVTKKVFCFALGAMLFALESFAGAQQIQKIPRVGYLTSGRLDNTPANRNEFRQSLRDLGYVEGKNILIEWRQGDWKRAQVPRLAAELVRLKVDVIVTTGSWDTRVAKQATSTIPIIMTNDADPVGNGFVTTLARPGGNVTGLARLRPELSGKRLELLKEILPKLLRVAVLVSSTSQDYVQTLKHIEVAAAGLGLQLQYLDITATRDIEPAFLAASDARAEALLVRVSGPIISPHRAQFVGLATKNRLPAIYETAQEPESGGLMSYGTDTKIFYRRAAIFVDKILKGANPAELPVEQPTTFELVINLQAAKQIGLTIPPHVLARADRVIK
jgi:putative ABC transport system substrate-binding protein